MKSSEAHDSLFKGMGTDMLHRAYGDNAKIALESVEEEAGRLEKLLSRFEIESDVSRVNFSAGKRSEKLSSETCGIIKRAIRFSEISSGAFDVTVGPLIDLWDYKNATSPPGTERIMEALSLVDFREISVSEKELSIKLSREGQSIDLGGIAKGYASDRFMEIFKGWGVRSAFSNIGGNVSTLGAKPDGSPWRVGIRHPRKEELMGVVETEGDAVVTSGDYERFFIDEEGNRYHHILNPFTGFPAVSGFISATVIAKSSLDADALSTALFVAGLEKGEAILKICPWCEAVLVDSNLSVYITKGLKGRFEAAAGIRLRHL